MSTPGMIRRADRAADARAAEVASVAGSRRAGVRAAKRARIGMLRALDQMRRETAGDPAAQAVATTMILRLLVDGGPAHQTGDSLAHAARVDRQTAVGLLIEGGMSTTALAEIIGVDSSMIAKIKGGPTGRPARRATPALPAPVAPGIPAQTIAPGQTDLLAACIEAERGAA